jgi:hypothetical protein
MNNVNISQLLSLCAAPNLHLFSLHHYNTRLAGIRPSAACLQAQARVTLHYLWAERATGSTPLLCTACRPQYGLVLCRHQQATTSSSSWLGR